MRTDFVNQVTAESLKKIIMNMMTMMHKKEGSDGGDILRLDNIRLFLACMPVDSLL